MKRREFTILLALIALTTVALIVMAAPRKANSAEVTCPPNTPCKIVVITQPEEQFLLGPNGVFDMAEWAMRPLGPAIAAWREKIKNAPAGDAAKPPVSPATTPPAAQVPN